MKRVLCVLLCVVIMFSICVLSVNAAEFDASDSSLNADDTLADSGKFVMSVMSDTWLLGDVDLDGDVTSIDTLYTMRYLVGLHNSAHMYVADVDLDGWVTIMDVTRTQRYLAGLSPMEYCDAVGVWYGPRKWNIARRVYEQILERYESFYNMPIYGMFGHNRLSDTAAAALLSLCDYDINKDVAAGREGPYCATDKVIRLFHDCPATALYPDEDSVEPALLELSNSNYASLYTCLSTINHQLGYLCTILPQAHAANYYYQCICDWRAQGLID